MKLPPEVKAAALAEIERQRKLLDDAEAALSGRTVAAASKPGATIKVTVGKKAPKRKTRSDKGKARTTRTTNTKKGKA